ncbi:retropepsin-like aspartic protease family protein [Methyloprofundus sp.]|uniref:retropepsin-like aspartic protease family protein n=1 Tax=Methyloprofundus sp. TaxID=2020875 RepID=UPI003D12BF29
MKHPIFLVVLAFTMLYLLADNLLSRQSPSYAIEHPNDFVQKILYKNPIEITQKGIIISADRRGHYSGAGLINNQPMEFMIDTGATRVAVPAKLAQLAGLKIGMPVISQTAAGSVRSYQTIIPSLRIGAITIYNAHAVILEKLDQVLIGMSVLKQFKVTQFDGKMTIEVND